MEFRKTNDATAKLVSSDGYQYSSPNGVLTEAQRDFYEANGYILIERLIEEDILEKCRKQFVDICEGRAPKPLIVMKEIALMKSGLKGENVINKVQDILYDSVFPLYFEHEKLLDVVSSITGPRVRAMHSMLINKPPGSSRHPSHQDLHYFPFRPTNKIVASWTAMEEVTRDNGCLFVVPGSHKAGILYPHDYPAEQLNKAFHGIVDEDRIAPESKRLHVSMKAGDTLFFHPLLIHGSGPNTTKRFRKAISCHYSSDDCYYVDVKGTSQENIETEVLGMAKSMGVVDVSFVDIWKHKSKLVRDVKSKM